MKKLIILLTSLIAATSCFAGCTENKDTPDARSYDSQYQTRTADESDDDNGNECPEDGNCGKCRLKHTEGSFQFKTPRGSIRKDRRRENNGKLPKRPPHDNIPAPEPAPLPSPDNEGANG